MKRPALLGVLLALLLGAVGLGTLRAAEPPLCPGAVALRGQLQTFQTMRFYLLVPGRPEGLDVPGPRILHVRADGRMVLDDDFGFRETWDGTALWADDSDVLQGRTEPPVHRDRWFTPLIGPLFQAFRANQVTWRARGPGYYGWTKRDNPAQYAELVHAAWADAGSRVFLNFAGSPQTLRQVDVYDSAGKWIWSAQVVRINYDLALPAAAFSPVAPPQPVFFPEVCPDGRACADSNPPGPIGG